MKLTISIEASESLLYESGVADPRQPPHAVVTAEVEFIQQTYNWFRVDGEHIAEWDEAGGIWTLTVEGAQFFADDQSGENWNAIGLENGVFSDITITEAA